MHSRKLLNRFSLGFFASGFFFVSSAALALPFNQDMVGNQLITGSLMREKPLGSVSKGSLSRTFVNREAVLEYKNPMVGDKNSVLRGRRLFAVNCQPCHGHYEDGKHVPGTFAAQMPSIDLTQEMIAKKPDGHFLGYIYFGGMAIMPAYGWKLSVKEHWDIVSYVRHLQTTGGKE